jgi:hypothetical protein
MIPNRPKFKFFLFISINLLLPWAALYFVRKIHLFNGLLFEQIFGAGLSSMLVIFCIYKFKSERKIWVILLLTLGFLITAQDTILNIDRSRSFYLLSWVERGTVKVNEQGIDLTLIKSNEKINLVEIQVRLLEQEQRHLIKMGASSYQLTDRGKILNFGVKILSKVFSLDNWERNNK